MGCPGCPNYNDDVNHHIIEKITKEQMNSTKEIYDFMKEVLENGGALGKISQEDLGKMTIYYNQFFNENKTIHLKRDLDEVYSNMKSLYHRIRRGEIELEETIEENEIKLCDVCGKKLHWNSKKTICKDCEQKNDA